MMLQSKKIVLKVIKDITGYHYIYTIILIVYLIKMIKKRNIMIMSLKLMIIVNAQELIMKRGTIYIIWQLMRSF